MPAASPIDRIEAFRKRMGWRFKWVSSLRNDFNQDYLDLLPKGRDEDGLPYPMAWVRHRDGYGD